MVLDWRSDPSLPHARCADAGTGDPVPLVRWYDTRTHDLVRLAVDEAGVVRLGPDGFPAVVVERRRLALEWCPLDGESVPDVEAP